jgi:AraC family transcriptional regulator
MLSQPSIINTPSEYVSLYPQSPLLSSLTTQWQRIAMVYTHQTAYELPEVCAPLSGVAIFTTPGVSERTIDGKTQVNSISPGDVMVIPAKVGHSTRWTGEGDVIVIGLEASLFTDAMDDAAHFTQAELVPQFPTPDPLIAQLGFSLKSVLEKDPMGSRLYAETTATMLAVHLLQHYSQRRLEFKDYTDGLPQPTLRRVIDYIQVHLEGDLCLADLAAIANLSPYYFARLFKQSTGYTPHQFVIRCRVERAKTLLLKGKDAIATIAQKVGFANQAHLNVHLKRQLGVTPKMLLEQRKNL